MSENPLKNQGQILSQDQPNSDGSVLDVRKTKFRWPIALFILVTAIIIQTFYWFKTDGDTSALVISGYIIWLSTALLFILWWLLVSGLKWKIKALGILIVAISFGVFQSAFRFEGFSGAFIPSFSLRFNPTGEEKAIRFWNQKTESVPQTFVADLKLTEEDWPQFRGHNRDGIIKTQNFRSDWNENPPKEIWKHPVGPAWTSFVLVGPYLFTQEQREQLECVVCYLAENGEEVWVHSDRTRHETPMGGVGPRANPVFHEGLLYSFGATGIINCLNASSGEVVWTRNGLEDAKAKNITWGMSASPLIHQSNVIFAPGGNHDHSIIAYDLKTGDISWANGNRRTGYASLTLMQFAESEQFLFYGNEGLYGLDTQTGKELWQFPWKNDQKINCAEPVKVGDDLILLSSGYGLGSTLLQLKQDKDQWTVSQAKWKTNKRFKMKFNAGVYLDGYLYALSEGILTCLEVDSGKLKWRKRGRYNFGQILLVNDFLLILTEDGEVALVEARPDKPIETARFKAIEGKTWNHPILSRGRLYVRNAEEAACFDVGNGSIPEENQQVN